MELSNQKKNLISFLIFITATGFFEKIQRTFYLPFYLGDIVSLILPVSIMVYIYLFIITDKQIKFNDIETYFFLLILFFLCIFYYNSSNLTYIHFSFINNYFWILNCYVIFRYFFLSSNINKKSFYSTIYFSILFLFFYNLIINLINNYYYVNDFYRNLVRADEITALTLEGYIISFFFYFFLIENYFKDEKRYYFYLLVLVNFFSLYIIESRGLWIFNFFSFVFILFFIPNTKNLKLQKFIIILCFIITLFNFGLNKISSLINSSIVGLNKNYNINFYYNFNPQIFGKSDYQKNKFKKYEEVIDNLSENNDICKLQLKCTKEDILESAYSKEISYALSSQTRYYTIIGVLKKFYQNPLSGIKIENAKNVLVNNDKIHSNLILLIATTGILGLIAITIFFYKLYITSSSKIVFIYSCIFIAYYSFFFDNIKPIIGLILLISSNQNRLFKND